jgi:hypothetical protein
MSEQSVKCVHEKDGMEILGTVIGFDCQGCRDDAQSILVEASKTIPGIEEQLKKLQEGG